MCPCMPNLTILLFPFSIEKYVCKIVYLSKLWRIKFTILCRELPRWFLWKFNNKKMLKMSYTMHNMFCIFIMFDMFDWILFIWILMCIIMSYLPSLILFTLKFSQMLQSMPNTFFRLEHNKEVPIKLSIIVLP
jgi:hypothetical protein